ncbi:hypothetical protein CsatB_019018 [Cannabis sativa]
MVLQRLQEHKLYAKFKKCEFLLSQVSFLGHIVSKDGIMVDPGKIESVRELPRPKKVIKEKFVVYYDASRKGLGCVLMQAYRVFAYASCQLNEYEQQY